MQLCSLFTPLPLPIAFLMWMKSPQPLISCRWRMQQLGHRASGKKVSTGESCSSSYQKTWPSCQASPSKWKETCLPQVQEVWDFHSHEKGCFSLFILHFVLKPRHFNNFFPICMIENWSFYLVEICYLVLLSHRWDFLGLCGFGCLEEEDGCLRRRLQACWEAHQWGF